MTSIQEKFANELHLQLAAHADPLKALQMAAYMKQKFAFLGIPTPLRREIVKPYITTLGKSPDPNDLMKVVQTLWQFDERECQYVAVDLLVKFVRQLQARHEPLLVELVQKKSWWDTVDLLASRVFGTLNRNAPELIDRINGYANHENMWMRRVAILVQLHDGERTDRKRLAYALESNLADKDFFIRKAMGWALRQLARTDPIWVKTWLDAHAGQVSGLTRREALKHL
jgi:3-methyladenine DNA glycosylase AlkD